MDLAKWIQADGFNQMDSAKWIQADGFNQMDVTRWIQADKCSLPDLAGPICPASGSAQAHVFAHDADRLILARPVHSYVTVQPDKFNLGTAF